MAQVDLYGADAGRIRNAYQTSLQRDASDDEVSGWLSGSYGGGGIDQWTTQIAGSDEARQKTASTTTPPAGTVLGPSEGESHTGRPQSSAVTVPGGDQQIADWYTQYLGRPAGQADYAAHAGNPQGLMGVHAAIQNSPEAQAYRNRPTATTPPATGGTGWDANPGGNYSNWFLQNVGGMAPSGRNLESLAPQLAKYGIKLGARNAQGMIDTIVLPDGSAWDVIESATLDGGKRWQWIPAGGSGGGQGYGGVGGGQLPGNQYSDPYTKMMEELIRARIGMLQQPIHDPYRQQYQQGMQRRADALGQAEPQYQQLLSYLQKRFESLQGPGYTGAENEAIRTQALDPIENDRAAARKRVLERISSRGLNPDSGIAQQMLADVDKAFDGFRAQNQTTLTTNDLARRESRQQRAESLGGALVDIPQARAREQLDVFSALDALSQAMRGEEEARSREAIGYAGGLNDLSAQRFQMALQAAGMGGNPASIMNSLTGIAGLNQNASLLNAQNSSRLWSSLGAMIPYITGGR